MDYISKWLSEVIAISIIAIIMALIMAIPVMFLWDWIMPALFGLGTITLFQAWGLSVLCALLFKNNSSK